MPKSIGSPSPVGAKPPMMPPMGMPPGPGGDAGAGMLTAETVGYHADPHNCGNCKHQSSGQCEVIGEQVTPVGGCSVWEGGGDQTASPEGMSPEGMGSPDAMQQGAGSMQGGS
jgi:hypothetical protein